MWTIVGRFGGSERVRSVLAVGAALAVALWAAGAEARGCRHDADCDGLTNPQERALGTSRSSADTDHDGMSDGGEVKAGTDPLDADTDDDGLDDGDEMTGGTSATSADSDGDGVDDGDDDDPHGELEPKIVGPVGVVDASGQTIAMFGCLVIDASTAELDGFALADLVSGTVVKIKLDGTALPALKATEIERVDGDHDGVPDDDHGSGDDEHPGAAS